MVVKMVGSYRAGGKRLRPGSVVDLRDKLAFKLVANGIAIPHEEDAKEQRNVMVVR
jgi:hypothetical protein